MRILAVIPIFSALVLAFPAFANDPIDAFLGYWTGTAGGHIEDNLGFSLSNRDLDVTFEKTDTGFALSWTTGFRKERGKDPAAKKQETLIFNKRGPGFYLVGEGGVPAMGKPMTWAKLEENNLWVNSLSLDENGTFHLASWHREILNPREMRLRFVRRKDDKEIRFVRGGLIKAY